MRRNVQHQTSVPTWLIVLRTSQRTAGIQRRAKQAAQVVQATQNLVKWWGLSFKFFMDIVLTTTERMGRKGTRQRRSCRGCSRTPVYTVVELEGPFSLCTAAKTNSRSLIGRWWTTRLGETALAGEGRSAEKSRTRVKATRAVQDRHNRAEHYTSAQTAYIQTRYCHTSCSTSIESKASWPAPKTPPTSNRKC